MTPDWSSFFGIVTQVAITGFSIMFLSLQVKSSDWHGRTLLYIAAVAALVELFVPTLIGLIVSMGGHPWRAAAALGSLLGLSVISVHATLYWRQKNRNARIYKFDQWQARGALLSLAVYGTIAVTSTLSPGLGIHLLAAMCTWLLFSGSFEAWWLLSPFDFTGKKELVVKKFSRKRRPARKVPESAASHSPPETTTGESA